MWPAVAAAVRPENVRLTVIIVELAESATVPMPVPGEAFGGTSCAPDNVTVVVHVGPAVGVAVAVAVFVGVEVNFGVLIAVPVAVGVNVGVCDMPPGIVTLPFVVEDIGSPSLNTKAGWKFMPGSV